MSTYNTKANIFIGGIKINKYKAIKVNKSLDGSSATVRYADNLQMGGEYLYRSGSSNNPMAVGQSISIDMGWDKLKSDNYESFTTAKGFSISPESIGDDNVHFIGIISKITQDFKNRELIVECEDYGYLLKRMKFDFSVKTITLLELGEKLIAEMPTAQVGMNLNDSTANVEVDYKKLLSVGTGLKFPLKKYVAEKVTGYEILKHLADTYNIRCFFIGTELLMGVNYLNPNTGAEETFRFTQTPRVKHTTNMLYALDTAGLMWQNSKDVKYKITANVVSKTSEVTEYTLGDVSGDEREFWFYGDYKKVNVEQLVENELSRLKYDGFKEGSSISSFGRMRIDYRERDINVLDSVILDGVDYRVELDGKKTVLPSSSYLCDKVEYTMDSKGFNALITLGQLQPVKITNFYEKDSSFNTSNLEYTATYITFGGTKTFSLSGKTSVETVVTPEPEPLSENVKNLKNILSNYKSELSIMKGLLTEQTTLIEELGYFGGNSEYSDPVLSPKFILFKTVDSNNISYQGRELEPVGQPIDGYNYNPFNMEEMEVLLTNSLIGDDVTNIKKFNSNVDLLIQIVAKLQSYWSELNKLIEDKVIFDLTKLTVEEKYIYDKVTTIGQETTVVTILSIA